MKDMAQAVAAIGLCGIGVLALIYDHGTAGGWIIFFGICCLFGGSSDD